MRFSFFLLNFIFAAIFGCTSDPTDRRLLDISENVSKSPEMMLVKLDSIDIKSLKNTDKYFYTLLQIKANDKAYVRHTSDSAILRIINYYSRHKQSEYYPEALYYGGRVYSDIGDAPTALKYFQDALDALPDNADKGFRATVLSQTGRILNSLRLYNEAARYLKDALLLRCADSDSIKQMNDIILLGAIYMHAKEFGSADSCFHLAKNIARNVSPNDTTITNMYIAGNELYSGNVKNALDLIRTVVRHVPEKRQDLIYAYACQIYLEAGIRDSAYIYATKLINSHNIDYKKNGYSFLLSPELRDFSTPDSLLSYTLDYKEVLEKYLDRHDAQQVSLQTSYYNYQKHERERKKAEEKMKRYMHIAGTSIIVIVVLLIVLMYQRNRRLHILLQYHRTLEDISLLKNVLYSEKQDNEPNKLPTQDSCSKKIWNRESPIKHNENDRLLQNKNELEKLSEEELEKNKLRSRLKEELLTLQKSGQSKKGVPEAIIDSFVYRRLQEHLKLEKRINDTDELWKDIEGLVLNISPEFKSRLYLLAGDRLKEDAYHMALLIRCGITPTELTILIGRSKGAISSRRGYICQMIFGQKLGAKVMDDIIRLL